MFPSTLAFFASLFDLACRQMQRDWEGFRGGVSRLYEQDAPQVETRRRTGQYSALGAVGA